MFNFKVIIIALCFFVDINGETRKFPDNFVFGVATASYQIEGAWNVSDKSESIWDHLVHNTHLVNNNDDGDVACNSYNLYKRDVEMLSELGVNYYRFSLSWTRILPTAFANKISKDGVKYYNNLIDSLLAKNIEPVVTLYHWDLPQSLQDLGGWVNPMMVDYYTDYAKVVFQLFGDRVKTWVTFNEPWGFCLDGYDSRRGAPALNMSGIGGYLCAHTVLKAHAQVYHLYDKVFRPIQKGKISLTLDVGWYEPETHSQDDLEASEIALQFEAGWFAQPIFSKEGDYPKVMRNTIDEKSKLQGFRASRLPRFTKEEIEFIRGTYDYFGLNHYSTNLIKKNPKVSTSPSYENDRGLIRYQRDDWPGSASSWLKVVPWGFTKLLRWIRETYNNPEVMILENGFSDEGGLQDNDRINYIKLYLNALLDAVDEGSNITAYTVWSLMDNFEWLAGYRERFGLYFVNYTTPDKTRTPKTSVKFYSDVIKNKAIERSVPKYYHQQFVPNIIQINSNK